MQDTSIAWADWTWNPIKGCDRISPGCLHCYAEAIAARFSSYNEGSYPPKDAQPFAGFAEFRIIGGRKESHWTGKVELVEHKLLEPLSWRRKAAKFREQHGRKPRAFISMSDLFHESLPDEAIDRVFAVMAFMPEVAWMILTKRAKRMGQWASGGHRHTPIIAAMNSMEVVQNRIAAIRWPLSNVALGVSVESQKYADQRIPHLLRTPAAMRFVSYEPALEAVDFSKWGDEGLECSECAWRGTESTATEDGCENDPGFWCPLCSAPAAHLPLDERLNMIIVGGESGSGARPFDLYWARQTVKQCRAANVAPFVKQMGSNPGAVLRHEFLDGKWKIESDGRLRLVLRNRKGEDMSEWPEDLRVREWPEGWN